MCLNSDLFKTPFRFYLYTALLSVYPTAKLLHPPAAKPGTRVVGFAQAAHHYAAGSTGVDKAPVLQIDADMVGHLLFAASGTKEHQVALLQFATTHLPAVVF